MKKGSIKIYLAACVLLVIGIILLRIFWIAIFPSVGAWIHDWLGNPIGLTAIATVGTAIGTIGAVMIALYGTRNERRKAQEDREEGRRQFLASQRQTQDALEEGRRQFLETQYAANKPLLVLEHDIGSSGFLIRNCGTGIAMNIMLSYWNHGERILNIGSLVTAIPKKEFKAWSRNYFSKINNLTINDKIGEYTLGVPRVYRYILTYIDIFGRKHASVFEEVTDLTLRIQAFLFVAFLNDIPLDIRDLIETREKVPTKDTHIVQRTKKKK